MPISLSLFALAYTICYGNSVIVTWLRADHCFLQASESYHNYVSAWSLLASLSECQILHHRRVFPNQYPLFDPTLPHSPLIQHLKTQYHSSLLDPNSLCWLDPAATLRYSPLPLSEDQHFSERVMLWYDPSLSPIWPQEIKVFYSRLLPLKVCFVFSFSWKF